MNLWAKSGRYDCHFLCICVLGDRSALPLAREMSQEAMLTHCVNGFVDNGQDLPTHGQLGCKGFIILDSRHKVVSKETSAFMQVRDLAFDHVEALLDAVCAGVPPPRVCPGEFLQLVKPPGGRRDLLGARGLCVKVLSDAVQFAFVAGSLRGKTVQVPMSAVRKLDLDEETGCNGGGCGPDGCGLQGCGPDGCGPSGCESTGCGPKGCGPDGCGPEGCCPNGCGPNGCGPDGCTTKGCGPDGCGPRGCGPEADPCDETFVAAALSIGSVSVPSMDAEHDQCVAALRTLATERTCAALSAALACMEEHFAHEEALLVEFGFGAHANERFSARQTHVEDHRRILEKMRQQLRGSPTPKDRVSADVIRELLQDFHDHATRYDAQYAEPLRAQGAR